LPTRRSSDLRGFGDLDGSAVAAGNAQAGDLRAKHAVAGGFEKRAEVAAAPGSENENFRFRRCARHDSPMSFLTWAPSKRTGSSRRYASSRAARAFAPMPTAPRTRPPETFQVVPICFNPAKRSPSSARVSAERGIIVPVRGDSG